MPKIVTERIIDRGFANSNRYGSGISTGAATSNDGGNRDNASSILSVYPESGLSISGSAGDDFTANTIDYVLTNNGTSSIDWYISSSRDWVSIDTTSGRLAAGANTTITLSVNDNASYLRANNYSDVVEFKVIGYGIATTRNVTLEITGSLPTSITLDTIIRGSYGPVSGSGGSFAFTIPDWVVAGDEMMILAANRTHRSDAQVAAASGVFEMGINSHTGWDAYTDTAVTILNGVTYANQRIAIESFTRTAGVSEAGTEYTFSYIVNPESYYWYFIAFNGTYIDQPWEVTSGLNDIDGYGDPTQSNFYVDSVTIANANSGLMVMGAIAGNVRVQQSASQWRELADVGNSDVSLFAMVRLVNAGATGVINAYMDDTAAYFASIGVEMQGF